MAAFIALSHLQKSGCADSGWVPRSRRIEKMHAHRPSSSVKYSCRSGESCLSSRLSQCHDLFAFIAAEEAASAMRRERRWWSIYRSVSQLGFWETKVHQWHRIANAVPVPGEAEDYLDLRYLRTFRVDHRTFQFLLQLVGCDLEHSMTWFRTPVAPAKRPAMCLHWLAHAKTFDRLGEQYCTGTSTAHSIVHGAIAVLKGTLVPSAFKFPSGRELDEVMSGFRDLAQLQMCAGAVDGTFVHMKKPALWGDNYWCYENFIAIHMLAVCDHRCQFTYVDVGRAGCVGDAFSYGESSLRRRIVGGNWLQDSPQDFDGTTVRPYLIGDSAFPLEAQMRKCYDQRDFNTKRSLTKLLFLLAKKSRMHSDFTMDAGIS